jgi:hypothetical protein
MKNKLITIMFLIVLVIAEYLRHYQDIEGLQNIGSFILYSMTTMLIVGLFALNTVKDKPLDVIMILSRFTLITLVVSFAYNGAFVMATIWTIYMIAITSVRFSIKIKKLKKENI